VDVATLAATARALTNGCQPIDFAGWGASVNGSSAAQSANENCALSSGHGQSMALSLPKVNPSPTHPLHFHLCVSGADNTWKRALNPNHMVSDS